MVGSRDVLEGQQLAHHVLHLVSAEPVPTTASLIWLGENSSTSRSHSAHATSAAPRACPVANALCTFTPNHTVSIPAHVGRNRAMTAAICSWIFRRR